MYNYYYIIADTSYICVFFRILTEPDLQPIDNINSSKLLFVGNLFIIGYIVFHELPVYI